MAEPIPHPAAVTDPASPWTAPDPAPVVRPGEASGFAGVGPDGPPAIVPPPVHATGPTGARWAGDPAPSPDDAA